MSINNLKVLHNQIEKEIPSWVRFANVLGEYIYEYGYHYKKNAKVVISLPTQQYFSLFVAMGIANRKFSVNKQTRSIRKTFLSMESGKRIIYLDNDKTRKMSVLALEESPITKGEMLLKVMDAKGVEFGIPERQWLEKIIILDEDYEGIKQSIKVNGKKQLGLNENTLLKNIYSQNQLNRNAFFPGDYFYLIGNLADVEDCIKEEIFISEGERGSLQDFLYLNKENSYTNGKLISSQKKKLDFEVIESTPIIFTDSLSYLKQKKNFQGNPQIIITSRTESESRLLEITEELKREYLQHETTLITGELLEFIHSNEVKVPNGVELIGWR
ncbi:hypothetical protein [Pontibacillus litoralis]|uniref:Uncharacterized protein n=1 Tax=Pontibacillus litoralis JSM 072002 TaxID=1385512 RepID=A0A0A5G166_9BACI|nr:hypothetical protein [Pontibacillus litoralis]KGX85784.1 hypothetical protein N784_08255 [Pontibacillus litoralis JSM 072002]